MTPTRNTIAFSCPGGEDAPTVKSRPIDLVHLERQTFGDRKLEEEVLHLFVQQLATIEERIRHASEAERCELAHTLKGAASGVGAFAVAKCAETIEKSPGDARNIRRLSDVVADVRDFIAGMTR